MASFDPFPYLAHMKKLKLSDKTTEYEGWAKEVEAILSLCGVAYTLSLPRVKQSPPYVDDTKASNIIMLCLARCMLEYGIDTSNEFASYQGAQNFWQQIRRSKLGTAPAS